MCLKVMRYLRETIQLNLSNKGKPFDNEKLLLKGLPFIVKLFLPCTWREE